MSIPWMLQVFRGIELEDAQADFSRLQTSAIGAMGAASGKTEGIDNRQREQLRAIKNLQAG